VTLVHLGGLMAVMAVMARGMLTGLGKLSLGRTTRLDHSQLSFDSFACNWPAVGKKNMHMCGGYFCILLPDGFLESYRTACVIDSCSLLIAVLPLKQLFFAPKSPSDSDDIK
jgi:hypothetical protein